MSNGWEDHKKGSELDATETAKTSSSKPLSLEPSKNPSISVTCKIYKLPY
jgi:hypothetical protein